MEEIAVLLMKILAGFLAFSFLMFVIQVIAEWRIFTKMGDAGWISLIPFYREYVLFRRTWNEQWYWIWLACTIAGMGFSSRNAGFEMIIRDAAVIGSSVIFCVEQYHLSRSFGHDIPFMLGLIFLNPLFLLILGLGSSQYLGNETGEIHRR